MSVVAQTESFVRQFLSDAESGHGWWHIDRVRNTALRIAALEGDSDPLIVELGALLHDIADAKFHDGDEDIGPRLAREHLRRVGLDEEKVEAVTDIVRHVSFRKRENIPARPSPELAAVIDADRLDAMGAIGIARAFHYGGFRNRPIHAPDGGSSIGHFYDKLLHLKDMMYTATGRRMALERHAFMERFLDQFYEETQHAPDHE